MKKIDFLLVAIVSVVFFTGCSKPKEVKTPAPAVAAVVPVVETAPVAEPEPVVEPVAPAEPVNVYNPEECYNSLDYIVACQNRDFDTAHKILDALKEKYAEERNAASYFYEERDNQNKYLQAFDYIYKEEFMSMLGTEDYITKIQNLLESIPVDGKKPDEGICAYYSVCRELEAGRSLDEYILGVEHYNNLCSNILMMAITHNDKELAQMVITRFRDNVKATRGSSKEEVVVDGVKIDGNHGYIKLIRTEAEVALARCAQASKMGALGE